MISAVRDEIRMTFASRKTSWLFVALLALLPSAARAQYATGGTGLYRNAIFWVDWGTNGENVFAGKTITRGFNIDTPASAANRLDITCQLSNAVASRGTAALYVYAPGDWRGDGLDELYNIGGNDPGDGVGTGGNPNTLSVGLRTETASTVEFDLDCSATIGGAPFPLRGLVFADGEASGDGEFVAARLTHGGSLRIIDQISQCGASTDVQILAGPPQEARLAGTTAHCQAPTNPPLLRGGPALVGFIDGAVSARIIAQGRGVSAVAVGAMIEIDFSEAIPATYGNAAHLLDTHWSGGNAVGGVNYNDPANLSVQTWGVRLGATVAADQNANGAVGGPDVDALPKTTGPLGSGYAAVTPPLGPAGTTYVIGSVPCVGPAAIAGWIDFNGNGAFDTGERSAIATCGSGSSSVNLSWMIPAPGTVPQATSYLRLRIAADANELASASGIATSGEAEDYRIAIPGPTLTLRKAWVGARVGDTAELHAAGVANDPGFVSIADATDEVDAGSTVPVYPGETAMLSESLGSANVGRYHPSLACSGASDADPTDGLSIGAGDAAIVCTYTNEIHRADLVLTKTNTPGANAEQDQTADTLVSGTTTAYVLTVVNQGPDSADGAVLRDPPGTGLSCATAACTANGGAACFPLTGAPLMTALQTTGVAIPVLPAGGSASVMVQCQVE